MQEKKINHTDLHIKAIEYTEYLISRCYVNLSFDEVYAKTLKRLEKEYGS